jgi:hypothetical protein
MVWVVSVTSASEIQLPVSGTYTAPGYFTPVQASSPIAAMALSIARLRAIDSENSAPCAMAVRMILRLPNVERTQADLAGAAAGENLQQ